MFPGRNSYKLLALLCALWCIGEAFAALKVIFYVALALEGLLFAIDIMMVQTRRKPEIRRQAPKHLSQKESSTIKIEIESHYRRKMFVCVEDEAPIEFQMRETAGTRCAALRANGTTTITYEIEPQRRGTYTFGACNVMVFTGLDLVRRRFKEQTETTVQVYPTFGFIHSSELMSLENYERTTGDRAKRRRGTGHEFDTIRDYVDGDNVRYVNWRATARSRKLMVNQYEDDDRQTLICVIEKGRGMQHSIEGMTMLDHSINAAVRLSYVALRHHDEVGFITLGRGGHIDTSIRPTHDTGRQMHEILSKLCSEDTEYAEVDYSALQSYATKNLTRRCTMVVFAPIDSMVALRRRLPVLSKLAMRHQVIVVFFIDDDLEEMSAMSIDSDDGLLMSALASKNLFEQREVVRELRRHGVVSVLSHAESLSTDLINKYLLLI